MYEYPYYQSNPMYNQQMVQQNQRMPFMQTQQQNMIQGQVQQPVQQFPAQPMIPRTVNAIEEITANDVAMNVPYSVFPKNDLSEIYVKYWNANGTIQSLTFKPVLDGNVDNSVPTQSELKLGLSDEATAAFMKRFDDIESKFSELEKSMTGSKAKATTSRAKKEDAAE